MIILDNECSHIVIPKLERCMQDPGNIYFLILHNNYTKEIWMFRLRDYRGSRMLYIFPVSMPVEFEEGEYTYYLVSKDEWNVERVSIHYPEKSLFVTDKEAVSHGSMYIVSNGDMLVTKYFKARLCVGDTEIHAGGDGKHHERIAVTCIHEGEARGDITREVRILNTGLLKYRRIDGRCEEFIEYDGGEHDHYVQYNG